MISDTAHHTLLDNQKTRYETIQRVFEIIHDELK